MTMVKLMCGVTLKDRKRNQELLDRLGIECVDDVVRRGRLRWFGHVHRKAEGDWLKLCGKFEVDGSRGRGAGRKTW